MRWYNIPEEEHQMKFKRRFEKALQQSGMTAAELSKKTGISEATLSQYRSGYSQPKKERGELLASALHVDPAWLMGYDTPVQPEFNDFVKALQSLNSHDQMKVMDFIMFLKSQEGK